MSFSIFLFYFNYLQRSWYFSYWFPFVVYCLIPLRFRIILFSLLCPSAWHICWMGTLRKLKTRCNLLKYLCLFQPVLSPFLPVLGEEGVPSFYGIRCLVFLAPHSSTLAWKIPWMEEPGGLQSMGLRRLGHDRVTSLCLFTFMDWRRKWQPTPVSLPGESQGRQSLVGCCLWGRTESDMTEATQQQQQQLCYRPHLIYLLFWFFIHVKHIQ